LECGDRSPLSDWQTCLPVTKRSHACALQITPLPTIQLGCEMIPLRVVGYFISKNKKDFLSGD
jgi:hypothetical protein